MSPDPTASAHFCEAIASHPSRLAALHRYHVLDTDADEDFDGIAKLAATICAAPTALVSLVAEDRQWFKARVGFDRSETDLKHSVCLHALMVADLLVIDDLATDPRTMANPLVTDAPNIRFYAGAPLRTKDGHTIGSLCVIDVAPRPGGLAPHQADALRLLARQVMQLLEMHRAIGGRDHYIAQQHLPEQRLSDLSARLKMGETHWRSLFERLTDGFLAAEVIRDGQGDIVDWRYLDVNASWGRLLELDPAMVVGRTVRGVFPDMSPSYLDDVVKVFRTGQALAFTRYFEPRARWYEGQIFPLEGDRFGAVFRDVTARVEEEARREGLLALGDATRLVTRLPELSDIVADAVRKVLGVSHAGLLLVDAAGELMMQDGAAHQPIYAAMTGEWAALRQSVMASMPLIVNDAAFDARTQHATETFKLLKIRSVIWMPVREQDRVVAILYAHDRAPRQWSDGTIAFLRSALAHVQSSVGRLNAEADQRVLNMELSHRMKNMLAMVQAIASQTLRHVTEQEAVAAFRQRIQALSKAHDMLLRQHWDEAPLRQVVEAVLHSFCSDHRYMITGPDIVLGSRATLSLSLILHELTTNALKYGALSNETGVIMVSWFVEGAQKESELIFTWSEDGGPLVAEPSRKGFGSRLLQAGLIGMGGVELHYAPNGFKTEMRCNLSLVRGA